MFPTSTKSSIESSTTFITISKYHNYDKGAPIKNDVSLLRILQ